MNPKPTQRDSTEYWHGLAALRALAMLLGVVLHAAIPYTAVPLSGMDNWICYQTSTPFCDMLVWWIHAWRIPLFFFLAGFFALQTLQRHGAHGFARRRIKRLCIPYIVAVYTVGPVIYLVFNLGWYLTGQCSWEQIWPHIPLPERLATNGFGPSHLWFLQELIILSFTFVFLYVVLGSEESESGAGPAEVKKTLPWWLPIGPGILSGLMLWSDTSPLTDWHNTFLCVPARLLYNCVFFIGGIVAYQHRTAFFQVTRFYRRHLILALPASAVFLWIRLSGAFDVTGATGSLALSISAGVFCWLMVYGMIGVFNSWFGRSSPVVSYLSDASYWVYIVHLPIVAALQLAVYDLNIHSLWKFAVVSVVTTVACLVSYQWLVRYTVVGSFLHGPRSTTTVTAEKPSYA
ncbi:MAG: acyltransferase family protein [Fuerstiella sp.]